MSLHDTMENLYLLESLVLMTRGWGVAYPRLFLFVGVPPTTEVPIL